MARQRGTVRFDPYFKVQTWEPRSYTWQDVQRQHPTVDEAKAAYPRGRRCRVMRITMEGRSPLPETEVCP